MRIDHLIQEHKERVGAEELMRWSEKDMTHLVRWMNANGLYPEFLGVKHVLNDMHPDGEVK